MAVFTVPDVAASFASSVSAPAAACGQVSGERQQALFGRKWRRFVFPCALKELREERICLLVIDFTFCLTSGLAAFRCAGRNLALARGAGVLVSALFE